MNNQPATEIVILEIEELAKVTGGVMDSSSGEGGGGEESSEQQEEPTWRRIYSGGYWYGSGI